MPQRQRRLPFLKPRKGSVRKAFHPDQVKLFLEAKHTPLEVAQMARGVGIPVNQIKSMLLKSNVPRKEVDRTMALLKVISTREWYKPITERDK